MWASSVCFYLYNIKVNGLFQTSKEKGDEAPDVTLDISAGNEFTEETTVASIGFDSLISSIDLSVLEEKDILTTTTISKFITETRATNLLTEDQKGKFLRFVTKRFVTDKFEGISKKVSLHQKNTEVFKKLSELKLDAHTAFILKIIADKLEEIGIIKDHIFTGFASKS